MAIIQPIADKIGLNPQDNQCELASNALHALHAWGQAHHEKHGLPLPFPYPLVLLLLDKSRRRH